MIITLKTECYPNQNQVKLIETFFGMRRFFFNKTIITLKDRYGDLKKNKHLIRKKEILEMRKNIFRDKYKALTKLAPSHILDTTMEDVMFALKSLWKKGKDINLRKKKYSNTCRWGNSSPKGSFRYKEGSKYISIPRLKFLKLAEPIKWKLNNSKSIKVVTIKKSANRYFISITCEIDDYIKPINNHNHLSIDWGIKTYLTIYNGEEFFKEDFDPLKLNKLEFNIAKYQKKLSKKVRFSNNWYQVKTKLEQAYLNFNNYRLDFIKKTVSDINKYYDSVTLEDLGMRFVISNKRLAHKAKQKPFYLFKQCLINKLSQYGKKVFKVPRNYPSTQTCSNCGNIKTGKDKMKLGQSIYTCHKCGSIYDRDENACINLFNYRNLELALLKN